MTARGGVSFKEVRKRAEWFDSDEEEDQSRTRKNPFDFDDSDAFFDVDSKWVSQADVKSFLKQSRGITYEDDEDDEAVGEAWGGAEYSIPDRQRSGTDPSVKSARLRTNVSASHTSASAVGSDFKSVSKVTTHQPASTTVVPARNLKPPQRPSASPAQIFASKSTAPSSSQISAAAVRKRTPVAEKPASSNDKKASIQNVSASISDAISSAPQISVSEYSKLQAEVRQLRKDLTEAKRGQNRIPSVEETIRRIMRGEHYSLEAYKSLKDKLALLDCALKRHDGNAILAVVLFLKRTINKSLFMKEIRKRSKAARHLCKYLESIAAVDELVAVHRYLGRREEAAMLKLKEAMKYKHPSERVRELQDVISSYFVNSAELADDSANLQEYITLLNLQIDIERADSRAELERKNLVLASHPRQAALPFNSVIVTLYYCCRYHYGEPESSISSPAAVRKQFQISDKQFEWTALPARAKLFKWKDIDEILTGKGWFGSVRARSSIGFDRVVELLHRSGSPLDILGKYLKLIEDLDKRCSLATKYKCHDVAIETLFAQKDRQKLEEYRGKLDRYSPAQTKITNYLKNSQVKWRN